MIIGILTNKEICKWHLKEIEGQKFMSVSVLLNSPKSYKSKAHKTYPKTFHLYFDHIVMMCRAHRMRF